MARRPLKDSMQGTGLIDEEGLKAFALGIAPVPPLSAAVSASTATQSFLVPIERIHRTFSFTPDQKPVRQFYDLAEIQIWAETDLAVNGIQSPIWTRPLPGGDPDDLELVAGLRRFLGAELLNQKEVPVIVRDWTDAQAFAAAISENANRQDFSPLEQLDNTLRLLSVRLQEPVEEVVRLLYRLNNEASGVVKENVLLSPQFEIIKGVFDFLGQTTWQSFVSSRLPLLRKPPEILEAIRRGQIQYTKALAVAKLKDPVARQNLLEQAIAQEWSLTQIQEQVAAQLSGLETAPPSKDRSLPQRLTDTYKRIKTAKVWADPQKAKQLEKLLKQLEKLVETDEGED